MTNEPLLTEASKPTSQASTHPPPGLLALARLLGRAAARELGAEGEQATVGRPQQGAFRDAKP